MSISQLLSSHYRPKSSLALELHLAFRTFQQTHRFIAQAHELELAPLEANILVEVSYAEVLGVNELTRILCLEQSATSRLLSHMAKRDLIQLARRGEDKRRRLYQLTKHGRKVLRLFDQRAEEKHRSYISRFTKEEVERLQRFLQSLANGYEAPPSAEREKESPLRAPFRRLARVFEMLSGNYFGLGINNLQMQIVTELYLTAQAVSLVQLSKRLSVRQSTISLSLKSLEEMKLVTKSSDTNDGRRGVLTLTPQGMKLCETLLGEAERRMLSALRNISKSEQQEGLALLRQLVHSSLPSPSSFTEKVIVSEAQRREARALYIRHLTETETESDAPECMVTKSGYHVGIVSDGKLAAVVSFESKLKHLFLNFVAFADSRDVTQPLQLMVERVIRRTIEGA